MLLCPTMACLYRTGHVDTNAEERADSRGIAAPGVCHAPKGLLAAPSRLQVGHAVYCDMSEISRNDAKSGKHARSSEDS